MPLSDQAIHQSMERKDPLLVSWIFFVGDRHPVSLRSTLGRRLAENDRVVIIEYPISVLRTHSIRSLERRISPIAQSKAGWHYHPLHFPEKMPGLSGIVRGLNRLLLRRELSQLIPDSTRRIICYDSPTQYHLAGKLGEHLGIYLAIDDRTRTVWGEPIPGELEAEKCLLAKVDLVICVSQFLAEALKARTHTGRSLPIHILPNGYDKYLYDPRRNWDEPDVLANVARPNILVAGHVSERIDWDGIRAAARARPKWTWLFVGPADAGLPEKIDSLNRSAIPGSYSNTPRFLWKAPIPLEQMPALISHCDACAAPYRLNPFTLASSPLKGIEYLAMGAPVLSTRIPALLRYGAAIQWVEQGDGESYARALDNLEIEQRNPAAFEARRLAVSGDSNEARIQQFRQIILNEGGLSDDSFQTARKY